MKFRPSLGSTKSKSNVSSTASPTPLSPSASQSSISTVSSSSAPVAKAEPSQTPSPAPASTCTSTLPDLKPVIPDIKPLLKPEPTAQVLPVIAPPPSLIKKPESPKPSARRAKTKFRPSGANKSPSRAPHLNLSLSAPALSASPVTSPVLQTPPVLVKTSSDPSPSSEIVLQEVAVPENGAAIDPPDALVYQNESVQDSLFQFKVPPPENPAKRAKHSAKNQLGTLSISTGKSSRAESIARKRKAEDTIKKNTAEDGIIDKTEVSMSDLIHVGGKCGTFEMNFSKKLREQREAKERATTASQLSSKSNSTVQTIKSKQENDPAPQRIMPKIRVINGKMVLDQESLFQKVQATETTLNTEEVVEDFDLFAENINSLSFRKRKYARRSKNWHEEETDRFYEALTIVGNDFEALSGAFVGRSASEIKRKFIRENKQDSSKIDALLKVHASGESDWDLSRLQREDAEFHAEIERNEELKQARKRERQENAAKKASRNEKRKRENNNSKALTLPGPMDMEKVFGPASENS